MSESLNVMQNEGARKRTMQSSQHAASLRASFWSSAACGKVRALAVKVRGRELSCRFHLRKCASARHHAFTPSLAIIRPLRIITPVRLPSKGMGRPANAAAECSMAKFHAKMHMYKGTKRHTAADKNGGIKMSN